MRISCDECAGRQTAACGDCVVTYLLSAGERAGQAPPGDDRRATVVDLATERAIRLLIDAGLVAPDAARRAG